MTAPIKVFHYAQPNNTVAGALDNTAGALTDILDACLVNGFSDSIATTSVIGDGITTTVTTGSAHGFVTNDVITIAGVTPSGFNGDYVITLVNPTTFTYSNTTNDTATVQGTAETANLGWTINQTGTNKRAYKAPSGNQMTLRVDDTGTTYASVASYESMTDVDTGSDPTTTVYWYKSNDATAKRWWLVGDERMFYLLVEWHSSYDEDVEVSCFGEIHSIVTSDAYNTILIGATSTSQTAPADANTFSTCYWNDAVDNYGGAFLQRSYDQTTKNINFWKVGLHNAGDMGYGTRTGISDTNALNNLTNGVHLSTARITEHSGPLRGTFPGLYEPLEYIGSGTSQPKYAITGFRDIILNNKTYMSVSLSIYSTSNTRGACFFDVTGPWR